MKDRALNILGIRGIPASHGGFETFAERLALYLTQKGWDVTVYCQSEGGAGKSEDLWRGVRRRHMGAAGGWLGTIEFDLKATLDVLGRPGIDLVLGYNTAVFQIAERLCGRYVLINMDGIEWRRAKWSRFAKLWFYVNERIGVRVGNKLIADHPDIARHLERGTRKRAFMIPYGADEVVGGDARILQPFEVDPCRYLITVARVEPENSILDIVMAFSRKSRGVKLVVLGRLEAANEYHNKVLAAASDEVVFPGAVYQKETLSALRFFAKAYVHGHQVGGTNPSLVEALGAGNAVIAHDNVFNRWTTEDEQVYFSDTDTCEECIERVLEDDDLVQSLAVKSRKRFADVFRWQAILEQYESLLENSL